jgi:hypothetical protein
MRPIAAVVRKTAIGSLLPDSTSRIPRTRRGRLTPLPRRIANVAAASVEEMIAPIRNPSSIRIPNAQCAMSATTSAVIATPAVARTVAAFQLDRTVGHSVSNPPEKRMKTSAITPSCCGAALSK